MGVLGSIADVGAFTGDINVICSDSYFVIGA